MMLLQIVLIYYGRNKFLNGRVYRMHKYNKNAHIFNFSPAILMGSKSNRSLLSGAQENEQRVEPIKSFDHCPIISLYRGRTKRIQSDGSGSKLHLLYVVAALAHTTANANRLPCNITGHIRAQKDTSLCNLISGAEAS